VECIRKAETTTSTITTGKRATSLRIPSHLKRNNEVAEMAKASKKHVGPGSHGKSDGSGAMTDIELENLPENAVLSNRDKANHTSERGMDGKEILNEQFRDHSSNRWRRTPELRAMWRHAHQLEAKMPSQARTTQELLLYYGVFGEKYGTFTSPCTNISKRLGVTS
jgi:hypothetical protein